MTFLFASWPNHHGFGPEFFVLPPWGLLCAHLHGLLSSGPFLSALLPSSPLLSPEHSRASVGEGDGYSGSSFPFFPLTFPSVPIHLPAELFLHGSSYSPFHKKVSTQLEKELFFSLTLTTPLLLPSKACFLLQTGRLTDNLEL